MERNDTVAYDPAAIEAKWQRVWEDEQAFVVPNPEPGTVRDASKTYVVEMLPYPSGELHMGHTLNYTIGDVLVHLRRRSGLEVLRPMGYDAFGLPAENAAINERRHPREVTDRNIATIRAQMGRMGWAMDWSRELSTADPSYYRWTQWLFLRFFEKGLAYRKEAPVKWCPKDQTVLANEQVIDGHCERCGTEVEAKSLTQWFFKITDYADALLDEMELLEQWPERVLTMQRNWIGRSHGARVVFRVDGTGEELPVFTTRPDTLFGATFFVLAPEHPLVGPLTAGTEHETAVADYVRHATARTAVEREAKEKDGVFTGRYAVNPVNGEVIPIWVADYVLMEYGTGAIMAVPAHDERDHTFAEKYELEIRQVVAPADARRAGRRRVRRAHGARGARQLRPVHGPVGAGGQARDHVLAGGAGAGGGDDRLPPARLAAVTPAVLGLPDPDRPLRNVRSGAGAGRSAPGGATRRRGLHAQGALAARGGRGVGRHRHVRRATVRRAARRTRWTPSSTRRGTSSATAIRTTTRSRSRVSWPTTGCRSTSTSAASSTRCCTCSTAASSRR